MTRAPLQQFGQTVGQTLSRVARRLLGFILLVVAIGMSSCDAMDAVRHGSSSVASVSQDLS